jgi:hypothetical protein
MPHLSFTGTVCKRPQETSRRKETPGQNPGSKKLSHSDTREGERNSPSKRKDNPGAGERSAALIPEAEIKWR